MEGELALCAVLGGLTGGRSSGEPGARTLQVPWTASRSAANQSAERYAHRLKFDRDLAYLERAGVEGEGLLKIEPA